MDRAQHTLILMSRFITAGIWREIFRNPGPSLQESFLFAVTCGIPPSSDNELGKHG
jgi:hypothetical protein